VIRDGPDTICAKRQESAFRHYSPLPARIESIALEAERALLLSREGKAIECIHAKCLFVFPDPFPNSFFELYPPSIDEQSTEIWFIVLTEIEEAITFSETFG
jgi:hypothetical protein